MKDTRGSDTGHDGNFYYWRRVTELVSVILEAFLGLLLLVMWLLLR